MQVLYITNNCSATKHFLLWFEAAYKVQLASYSHETVPEYAGWSHSNVSLASVIFPGRGTGPTQTTEHVHYRL